MKNNWSLHVAGVGPIDAAQDLLTNFVSTLREKGLTIDQVRMIDGTLHADLDDVESSESGWTLYAYGSGDVTAAYDAFPTFLGQFKDAGIEVQQSGIMEGSLRDVPVSAYS